MGRLAVRIVQQVAAISPICACSVRHFGHASVRLVRVQT